MKIQLNKKYEAYNEKKRKKFFFEFTKDLKYNTNKLILNVYNDDSEKTTIHHINTLINYSDDIDIYFEQHYNLSLFKINDVEIFTNFSNSTIYRKYVKIVDITYLVCEYKKVIAVDSDYNKVKTNISPKVDYIFHENNKYIFTNTTTNKCGIIDRDGNILVDFIYDKIEYVVKNIYDADTNKREYIRKYKLLKDGLCGLMNDECNVKTPLIYKKIIDIDYTCKPCQLFIVMNVNDKYGVINFDNEIILDFEYDEIKMIDVRNIILIKKEINRFTVDDLYEQNKLNNNLKMIYENRAE